MNEEKFSDFFINKELIFNIFRHSSEENCTHKMHLQKEMIRKAIISFGAFCSPIAAVNASHFLPCEPICFNNLNLIGFAKW